MTGVENVGYFPYKYRTFWSPVIIHIYSPMKMEQTACPETLALKLQTPVNWPEESIQRSEHGESSKSRTVQYFVTNTTLRISNTFNNWTNTLLLSIFSVYSILTLIHTCHVVPCHAVPLRLCLSNLIYTARQCLIHTCHAAPVPCHDHAVLKVTSRGHGTARHGCGMGMAWHVWISIGCPETACGRPARFRLLPATTRSSTKVVIRSISIR
jgi:hypothetical protein